MAISQDYPDIKQVNDERWAPPLPDAQKPVDPNSPKCHGCGRYHGSVNVEINCMRRALAKARDDARVSSEVRAAGERLIALRKEVSEAQRSPCSLNGSVEQLRTGKRPPGVFAQG